MALDSQLWGHIFSIDFPVMLVDLSDLQVYLPSISIYGLINGVICQELMTWNYWIRSIINSWFGPSSDVLSCFAWDWDKWYVFVWHIVIHSISFMKIAGFSTLESPYFWCIGICWNYDLSTIGAMQHTYLKETTCPTLSVCTNKFPQLNSIPITHLFGSAMWSLPSLCGMPFLLQG